uniref:Uncharacterized protein n=1 Tax=Branchiostoma floridae TaxID=7739 RepID=C3ZUQ8_BRAFL|eukprot:XP_002587759.1 hypothetical protein BRAFLDRAFT_94663 [Branchiostoma floridae]
MTGWVGPFPCSLEELQFTVKRGKTTHQKLGQTLGVDSLLVTNEALAVAVPDVSDATIREHLKASDQGLSTSTSRKVKPRSGIGKKIKKRFTAFNWDSFTTEQQDDIMRFIPSSMWKLNRSIRGNEDEAILRFQGVPFLCFDEDIFELFSEEETHDRVFSLSITPVHNEIAEATVSNLTDAFNDLQEMGTALGIDGSFAHVGQIKTHMKDRAAVETKVTRMLEDLKGDKLHETVPGWHLLSPEEQEKRKKIYGFTCAAHKIQNMAEAMSKAAQKNVKYDVEKEGKARRGMVGAKDHIYATAKLLCMETKKEYAEEKEFCGFALLHTELEDSGQKLFQPIVGNRFLVFFQNAIPCFVGKEMIQLYLTDKNCKKGNFNRLEEAVYNGYFNPNVMAEERAYSIMYYEVCLPLFSKCQEAGSPLDMNRYYQVVHDKLTEWANDATVLFEGSEPLWSQGRSADLQEYMLKVRQPHDTDDTTKETLSAMCKAGAEKLKQHAFEPLRGADALDATNHLSGLSQCRDISFSSLGERLKRSSVMMERQSPIPVSHHIFSKTMTSLMRFTTSGMQFASEARMPADNCSDQHRKGASHSRPSYMYQRDQWGLEHTHSSSASTSLLGLLNDSGTWSHQQPNLPPASTTVGARLKTIFGEKEMVHNSTKGKGPGLGLLDENKLEAIIEFPIQLQDIPEPVTLPPRSQITYTKQRRKELESWNKGPWATGEFYGHRFTSIKLRNSPPMRDSIQRTMAQKKAEQKEVCVANLTSNYPTHLTLSNVEKAVTAEAGHTWAYIRETQTAEYKELQHTGLQN